MSEAPPVTPDHLTKKKGLNWDPIWSAIGKIVVVVGLVGGTFKAASDGLSLSDRPKLQATATIVTYNNPRKLLGRFQEEAVAFAIPPKYYKDRSPEVPSIENENLRSVEVHVRGRLDRFLSEQPFSKLGQGASEILIILESRGEKPVKTVELFIQADYAELEQDNVVTPVDVSKAITIPTIAPGRVASVRIWRAEPPSIEDLEKIVVSHDNGKTKIQVRSSSWPVFLGFFFACFLSATCGYAYAKASRTKGRRGFALTKTKEENAGAVEVADAPSASGEN